MGGVSLAVVNLANAPPLLSVFGSSLNIVCGGGPRVVGEGGGEKWSGKSADGDGGEGGAGGGEAVGELC